MDPTTSYHIAQINIARMRGSREDPLMAEFFSAIDEINRLAEQSPGFVWRLQSDAGDATGFAVGEDDRLLVNLSVWESIEALKVFTYQSEHAHFLKRRKEWFEPPEGAHQALWWITKGRVPTLDEALNRLRWLDMHGPGSRAFTFGRTYPPPSPAQSAGRTAVKK